MVQLNSCCQVVKMVSAGEDGLMGGGGGGFNLQLYCAVFHALSNDV
jgi:hypothetical protein